PEERRWPLMPSILLRHGGEAVPMRDAPANRREAKRQQKGCAEVDRNIHGRLAYCKSLSPLARGPRPCPEGLPTSCLGSGAVRRLGRRGAPQVAGGPASRAVGFAASETPVARS